MRDGRTFSNHDDVPAALLEAVREEQQFMNDGPRRFGRRGGGPGPPPTVTLRRRARWSSAASTAPAAAPARGIRADSPRWHAGRPGHRPARRSDVLENPDAARPDDGTGGGRRAGRRHDGDRIRGLRPCTPPAEGGARRHRATGSGRSGRAGTRLRRRRSCRRRAIVQQDGGRAGQPCAGARGIRLRHADNCSPTCRTS